jgi:hypothetical protein
MIGNNETLGAIEMDDVPVEFSALETWALSD